MKWYIKHGDIFMYSIFIFKIYLIKDIQLSSNSLMLKMLYVNEGILRRCKDQGKGKGVENRQSQKVAIQSSLTPLI